MRRTGAILIGCLVSLWLGLGIAPGDACGEHSPGSFGAFFDLDGLMPCRSDIQPGVQYMVYFVAFRLPGDLFGFEFSVVNPDEILVLGRHPLGGESGDLHAYDDEWIVGTGRCLDADGAWALVVEKFLIFAPVQDLEFCVSGLPLGVGSSPLGGRPGWLACDETLHPFTILEPVADLPGCAVGNDSRGLCSPVSARRTSWGATKARFEN